MCSECRLCICVLLHLLQLLTSFKLALTDLVSFPGSYVGREKRGTHCLCMLSWIFDISVKSVRYTNLHETCQLFPPEKCLPLTTLCVDNDKGAIKGNKLFTYRNYACIRAFQLNACKHILPPQSDRIKNNVLLSTPFKNSNAKQDRIDHTFCFWVDSDEDAIQYFFIYL